MTYDPYIDPVREFHTAFDASTDPALWITLIEEETRELHNAMRDEPEDAVLKEFSDLAYVVAGFAIACEKAPLPQALESRFIAATDDASLAVAHALDHYGWSVATRQEAFLRVHRSNMSKLDDDGKPIRRADGKILKGPNYREPVLTDLV